MDKTPTPHRPLDPAEDRYLVPGLIRGLQALTAFTPERREMMLTENRAEAGRTVPRALAERFNRIREQGYESMPSAQTAGVFNLSAPILAGDGNAIAALTVPYIPLVNAADAPDMSDCTHLLVETCQRLSEMAGMREESA